MDWLPFLLALPPIIWFGYEFVAFCRDLEQRDKCGRAPSDDPW